MSPIGYIAERPIDGHAVNYRSGETRGGCVQGGAGILCTLGESSPMSAPGQNLKSRPGEPDFRCYATTTSSDPAASSPSIDRDIRGFGDGGPALDLLADDRIELLR